MKKLLLLLLVLIVGTIVGTYYYLDFLAQHAIEKYGSEALGVKVLVDDVKINLYQEKFIIRGLKIQNPKGYKNPNAIEIGSLETNIDLRTLFKKVIVIRSITVDEPNIFYSIGPAGDNIKALRDGTTSKSSTGETTSDGSASSAPKKIVIHKFFLNKGKVHASVEKIADKTLTLPDIYLQNIGKDGNGVTVEKAAQQIFRELSKAISRVNIQSLLQDITDLPNNLDGIGSQVKDHIDNLKEGINKLF